MGRIAQFLTRRPAAACLAVLVLLSMPAVCPCVHAQNQEIVWTDQEKPILAKIRTIRDVPDEQRGSVTKDLAVQVRQLPAGENKVRLANGLASRATEGDFGHDTLQEVGTTLALALREHPLPDVKGEPAYSYVALAQLARYEGVTVSLDAPPFTAAQARLEKVDQKRSVADFTLTDLQGKPWHLRDLRGKVVLVNFWATWCPPCRKEMPDLNALYARFKEQGLVILAISDEEEAKVAPFIAERKIAYPVLLDKDRKVNEEFQIEGLPKSYVYDRAGKLVAQSIDMRTQKQFLEMLGKAGLQ
jgi:peroxiredoxin